MARREGLGYARRMQLYDSGADWNAWRRAMKVKDVGNLTIIRCVAPRIGYSRAIYLGQDLI
jgi:hypothetical protein